MEFKCPEVKQLENYALNVINQDPLDSSIKTHLGLCLTCRDYVEKWKSHIKSEASAIIPKLENYEIQKLIGIGTHSKVYLAKHLHLNKTYAVKVIFPQGEDLEKNKESFAQETQILSTIEHPNIVRLIGAQLDKDGIRYLIFQYLDGKTLDQLLPIPLHKCSFYMEQMVLGLKELHQHHLYLGDVKPANFHVDKKDLLRLIDFGTAKDVALHGTQTTLGSVVSYLPYYRSPEQCRGERASVSSDIYCLGSTFYAMVNGNPAFTGYDFPETLNRIFNTPPTSLSFKKPEVSGELDRLILQMMAKQPENRPSLEEILLILHTLNTQGSRVKTDRVRANSPKVSKETLVFCVRCSEPREKFFYCKSCGERLCLSHQKTEEYCDSCIQDEKPLFLQLQLDDLTENLKKILQKNKTIQNLQGETTGSHLYEFFKSLHENIEGAFILFSMEGEGWLVGMERRLGLLLQPGIIRLFLHGSLPIRSLGQFLVDKGKITLAKLQSLPLNPSQFDEHEILKYFPQFDTKELQRYRMQHLSQELIPYLVTKNSRIKYHFGKTSEQKVQNLSPDLRLTYDTFEFTSGLAQLGHYLWALEQPGTFFLSTPEGKKIGIQLEEQRVKLLYFSEDYEYAPPVSWEDRIVNCQLSLIDAIAQDQSILDGEVCVSLQPTGQGSAGQRCRSQISQELSWFLLKQNKIHFDYVLSPLPRLGFKQNSHD
jgi:serine/threonine protein kinase